MYLTISYISNASEHLKSEDIEMMMIETERCNINNNIRGILVYSDQAFFQVLEGEYRKVMSLFEKIEKDSRHYNVLKILETKSSESRYKKFSSKYITFYKEKATMEIVKFLDNNEEHMPDRKLHNLIVYQSKILANMY